MKNNNKIILNKYLKLKKFITNNQNTSLITNTNYLIPKKTKHLIPTYKTTNIHYKYITKI